AGQRFPDRVRAKGPQIVDRDRGSCFGQSIAVRHGDAQVVEELQRLRLREGSANDNGFQASTKGRVHLLEQATADGQARAALRQGDVDFPQRLEDTFARRRQFVESCLQSLL